MVVEPRRTWILEKEEERKCGVQRRLEEHTTAGQARDGFAEHSESQEAAYAI